MSEQRSDSVREDRVGVETQDDEPGSEVVAEELDQVETGVLEEQPAAGQQESTDDTAEPALSIEQELQAARDQANEYLDQWRRSAAEFQNFRKRQERERQELIKTSNAQLLGRLLPVLDDLQRAAQHVPEELRDRDWVNGILMIERKLQAVLEQAGVSRIPVERGMDFDPNIHDALLAQPSDEVESGQIIDELEPGYKLHDRVLRPAKVRVAQ